MLKNRSYQLELLDSDTIPKEDLYQNLKELNFINTYLGGHAITIAGIKHFFSSNPSTSLTVAEVGCGGGDNLIAIAKWARANSMKIKLIGIDIKQDCINYANKQTEKYPEIEFIQSDYRNVTQSFDIIFSSLFCHHLTDNQLIEYFIWCNKNALKGFFVNDLQRNILAYFSIKWLTALFSKSYLVKNDAPLSVARGFHKSELDLILISANVKKYSIKWMWAFRYLIIKN